MAEDDSQQWSLLIRSNHFVYSTGVIVQFTRESNFGKLSGLICPVGVSCN